MTVQVDKVKIVPVENNVDGKMGMVKMELDTVGMVKQVTEIEQRNSYAEMKPDAMVYLNMFELQDWKELYYCMVEDIADFLYHAAL